MTSPAPTQQDPKPVEPAQPVADAPVGRTGELVFRGISTVSGLSILLILAAVAFFLVLLAVPALVSDPDDLPYGEFWAWVLPYAFGTVWAALWALLLAVPVAIGIALFISHYAPRRLAVGLGYIIDLLAAVPSVVFGLWGSLTLARAVLPLYAWLHSTLGQVPVLKWFFGGDLSGTGRTIFTAAMVLAVMILPIITAMCREIFLQTPRLHEEASLALGATRWEMIKQAVLPFGMPGIISAAMLGLGRALGETMAVAMVMSPVGFVNVQMLTPNNTNTIAANIALSFPESFGLAVNQLIASGLVLFLITLAVNMGARAIIASRAEFSGAN